MTCEDVATTVPDVEPVLTEAVNVSASSVTESPAAIILKVPVLLLIVNDPARVPPTKSFAVAVPDRV